MNKNKIIIAALLLTALIIAAWSPWITQAYAAKKAIEIFNSKQQGIADGCGIKCDGCGATATKVLFGAKVNLKYKCGMKDYFVEDSKFVSFIGSVH